MPQMQIRSAGPGSSAPLGPADSRPQADRLEKAQATLGLRSVFSDLLRQAGQEGWQSAPQALRETGSAAHSETVTAVAAVDAVASWDRWLGAHADRYSFTTSGSPSVRPDKGLEDLRQDYGRILQSAQAAGAYAQPQAYLRTLSQEDLRTVQQVHARADAIDPAQLSHEGALNLLLPPDAMVDLDRDGVTEVGGTKVILFPSSTTPPEVCAAWNAATANLSPEEVLVRQLQMGSGPQTQANTRFDSQGRVVDIINPGDPGWVNPFSDPSYTYKDFAKEQLALLDKFKGLMPADQVKRDEAFWRSFLDALSADRQRAGTT
jgi:hypothetical protein